MRIEDVFGDGILWGKYSDYNLKKSGDEYFITPAEGSMLQVYDAAAAAVSMMVDALNAGRDIKNAGGGKKTAAALAFSKRHGNLGMMGYLPKNMDFLEDGKVWLGRKNKGVFGKRSLQTWKYLAYFSFDKDAGLSDISATLQLPRVYNYLFSPHYREPCGWVVEFLSRLHSHFDVCFGGRGGEITGDDGEARSICFQISASFKPLMTWEPGSLRAIIETAYGFAVSSPLAPLKICKHCHQIFYSENTRSEFCGPKCRNKFNVYKSRGRLKNL